MDERPSPESQRIFDEAVRTNMANLINAWEPIRAAVGEAIEALAALGQAFSIGYASSVFDDGGFRYYAHRAYANYLNWHHPRGRKLSWRGLSRRQRSEAVTWYIEQQATGCAPWPLRD